MNDQQFREHYQESEGQTVIDGDDTSFGDPSLQEFEEYIRKKGRGQGPNRPSLKEQLLASFLKVTSTTYYAVVDTSIGRIYAAFKGGSGTLRMVSLEDEEIFLRKARKYLGTDPVLDDDPPETLVEQIRVAVDENRPYEGNFDISDLTTFQQAVLEHVWHIPAGETRTHAQVACAIGRPRAAGAVGFVLAHNPLPIIIPGHRVVSRAGDLGRDASGSRETKKQLLLREGVIVNDAYHIQKDRRCTGMCPECTEDGEASHPPDGDIPDTGAILAAAWTTEAREVAYKVAEKPALRVILLRYVQWIIDRYDCIPVPEVFPGIEQIRLPDIYIEPRIHVDIRPSVDRKQNDTSALVSDIEEHQYSRPWQYYHTVRGLCDLIQERTHIVMLGSPGSGKTIMLRLLALMYALEIKQRLTDGTGDPDQIPLPIPLQLVDYVQSGLPVGRELGDFLEFYFTRHGCQSDGLIDLLATRYEEGRCLILLDGLDEVPDLRSQQRLVQRINHFVAYDPHNQFIITSRETGYYYYLSRPFIYCQIQGMNKDEIMELVCRWHTLRDTNLETGHLLPSQEEKERQMAGTIQRIIRLTQLTHSRTGAGGDTVTPLLAQVVIIVYYIIDQHKDGQCELSQLITHALDYARQAQQLPPFPIDELLTLLLSRAVYEQYLKKHYMMFDQGESEHRTETYLSTFPWNRDTPQVKVKEDVKRAISERDAHKRPSTAVEEIVEVLSGNWAERDSPWGEDNPDTRIRAEVRDLLSSVQQQTDQIIMPTRHMR
jgi:O-6-methylguanine DNA methyltransferase